jgi:hypothetical protein
MGLFRDRRNGKNVELGNTFVGKNGQAGSWSDANKPSKVEGTNIGRITEHNDLMGRVNKALNPKPKRDPWTF